MCGIGAVQTTKSERSATTALVRSLLIGLESRGRDAAGAAWHDWSGETWIHKDDLPGKIMASVVDIGSSGTAIVHTRWATQGDPQVNENNHPIDATGVVGVHNGHVSNDDALLAMCDGYERKGEVDSEAIFALIKHGPADMSLLDRLALVKGGAAIAWLDTNSLDRNLHLARITSSPLWVGQTAGGSFIACSTKAHLQFAVAQAGLKLSFLEEIAEGTYLRIRKGRLCDVDTITVPKTQTWQGGRMPVYSTRSAWGS